VIGVWFDASTMWEPERSRNSGPPSTRCWIIACASTRPAAVLNLAINILTAVAAPAFHLNRWLGPKGFTLTAQAIDTYREEHRANFVNRH
jgi:hypothetical protein